MAPASNIFGLVWNNRVISFSNDEHENETWTIGSKIQENVRPEVPMSLRSANSVPEASATFDCFNYTRQTSGNLKVVIQMPHEGTEGQPWQSRGEQATSKLSDSLRFEIESLIRRKHESGSAAPMLFLWKVEKQTSAMPVPGGYVVYILVDQIKKESPRKEPSWRRFPWHPILGANNGTRRENKADDSDMYWIWDYLAPPPRKIARRELDDNWPLYQD